MTNTTHGRLAAISTRPQLDETPARRGPSDLQEIVAIDACAMRLRAANSLAAVTIPVLRVLLGGNTTEDTGQQTRHNHLTTRDAAEVLRKNDPI